MEDEAVQSRTNIDSAVTPPAVKFECNVIDGNAHDDLMENEPFENDDSGESKGEASSQLMAAKKRPGRQHKSVRKSSRRRETGSSLANGGAAKQTATEFSCDKCRLVVTVRIGICHFYLFIHSCNVKDS